METSLLTLLVGVSVIFVVTTPSLVRPQSDNSTSVTFQISPKQNESTIPLCPVNGARQCGGQGTLLEWRYESCSNVTSEDLYEVPAGVYGQGEISFIPKESVDALQIRVTVKDTSTGEIINVVEGIANGPLQGGEAYAISGGALMEEWLRGRTLNMQWSVFRPSDQVEELCAEADYRVV